MTATTRPTIDVVAGVIRGDDGRILICRRPRHLDQGGLWEFPGGKSETGESRFDTLERELEEELGIRVARATPLIRLTHAYPDKDVRLDVWDVSDWSGKPNGREGQRVSWVQPAALEDYAFPAANTTIITAARAPRLLLAPTAGRIVENGFLETLGRWFDAGFRTAVVPSSRSTDARISDAVMVLARTCNATIYFSELPPHSEPPEGGRRHLSRAQLRACANASVRSHGAGFSASVGTAAEIRLAEGVGADWVFIERAASPGGAAEPDLQRAIDASSIPAYGHCAFEQAAVCARLRGGYQGVVLADMEWRRSPHELSRRFRDYLAAAAYAN